MILRPPEAAKSSLASYSGTTALTVASRFQSSWDKNFKGSYQPELIAAAKVGRGPDRLRCTDVEHVVHATVQFHSDQADKRAHGGIFLEKPRHCTFWLARAPLTSSYVVPIAWFWTTMGVFYVFATVHAF